MAVIRCLRLLEKASPKELAAAVEDPSPPRHGRSAAQGTQGIAVFQKKTRGHLREMFWRLMMRCANVWQYGKHASPDM